MPKKSNPIVPFIQQALSRKADPRKAIEMAAYMKTEMPFYGVQKPDRLPIYRELARKFAPGDQEEYERNIQAMWNLPHREEKYAALEYASMFPAFVGPAAMPLYKKLIEDGDWWDFVDVLAINLVGHAFLKARSELRPQIVAWSRDENMWVRRTSLICHNHHKKETDHQLLFATCLQLCHEKEFFIRKAIGWSLREYSYCDPAAVKAFALKNKDSLSPLSFKEGVKQLVRSGSLKL